MTTGILDNFGGRRVSFTDKSLTCVDCGNSFIFTVGEQEFHRSKGFEQEPRRCGNCRASRKGTGASRTDGQRERVTVSCAACGQPATVPFQPKGDRPVYCSNCFQPQTRSTTVSCAACGQPATVPFQPRGDRPVYCSNCFQPQPRLITNASGFRGGYGSRGPAYAGTHSGSRGFTTGRDFESRAASSRRGSRAGRGAGRAGSGRGW